MRNVLLTGLVLLASCSFAMSQRISRSLVGATSFETSSSNLIVSSSAGEAIVGDLSNGHSISQGFQQAYDIVTAIPSMGLELRVFPNPASEYITMSTDNAGSFLYQLLQSDGKMLDKGFFTGSTQLDLNLLQPGIYLLEIKQLSTTQTFHKTIIKR